MDRDMIKLLREAGSVVALTGSGISAESGVPTFRGKEGLWKEFRAEELATPQAFYSDPQLVWEWYDWRRNIIARAVPNPGHLTIAGMEKHYPEFLLITQNVDGLHVKAGSRKLVEIHGNIWRVRCTEEGKESYLYDTPLKTIPPRCQCGALLRPAVVWFGEPLPVEAMELAIERIRDCDLLLSIGTSGVVHPVASFPMMAKSMGARIIEINPEHTPISSIADHSLRARAGDALPELWGEVTG